MAFFNIFGTGEAGSDVKPVGMEEKTTTEAGGGTDGTKGGTENNKGSQVDGPLNIWDNQPKKDGEQQQQTTQQTTQQQPDVRTQLDNYVKGLDFRKDVDMAAVMDAARNGDPAAFGDGINAMVQNAVRQMMMDTGKMLETATERAVDTAFNKSRTFASADQLVQQMTSKYEYMKDPDTAPVAKQVLTRALNQGKKPDEAIEMVHKYFERTASLVTGGDGTKSKSTDPMSGNSQFRGGRSSQMPADFWDGFLLGESTD